MARFNELLVGRYNRLAQKLLSMKGAANLATLAPELVFDFPLFNGAENRYLEAWDLFGVDVFPAVSGAGNLQAIELRNPAGSNVVAVVTRVVYAEGASTVSSFAVGASLQLNRGPVTTDQNTAVAAKGWDSRSRPSSTCVVSANVAGAPTIPAGGQGVGQLQQAAFVAGDYLLPGVEVPLLPGAALLAISGNTNTQTSTIFYWRERYLEESERA